MRNFVIVLLLSLYTFILAAISLTTETSDKEYAYKENYRGLDIEVEGIFLTTDPATHRIIANIPIRIINNTGNSFTFQSQEMDCNGKKVSGNIEDEYISGEIESGSITEDVITMEFDIYQPDKIQSLVYTYKIHDMKKDSSRTFAVKEIF